MQSKLCTRCQFQVPAKGKICPICGNKAFVLVDMEPALAAPLSEPNTANTVRSIMHDFADDVALTAEKSMRAWQQIRKLIRG